MVGLLRDAGVVVHVVDDRPEPRCPDAVFPNNWVSFHDDGTVVLYPMHATTRRRERRPELLQELATRGGYSVSRLLDLSHHELENQRSRGPAAWCSTTCTGSPTPARRRARTRPCWTNSRRARVRALRLRGTRPRRCRCLPHQCDAAIGSRAAVVCGESMRRPTARGDRLAAGGRTVVDISLAQLEAFAGNMLELPPKDGPSVLVMSAQARASLEATELGSLGRCVDRLLAVPVNTSRRRVAGPCVACWPRSSCRGAVEFSRVGDTCSNSASRVSSLTCSDRSSAACCSAPAWRRHP